MSEEANIKALSNEEVLKRLKCAVGQAALKARDGKCAALDSPEVLHWQEELLNRLNARRAAA